MAAVLDFTGGVLPAGATLARAAGPWSRVAANKLIEVGSAADTPRFDYDPVTGALRGLLVEPARTNLQDHSAPLNDQNYRIYGTLSSPGGLAPDGSANVRRVTGDGSAGRGFDQYPADYSKNAGAVATYSLFARATNTAFIVSLLDAGTNQKIVFDLQTGQVVSTDTPQGFSVSAKRAPNDFYRLAITYRKDNEFTFQQSFIDDRNATSGAIDYWGMQLTLGDRLTTYIPTSDGAASRPADVLTLDWAAKGVPDGSAAAAFTFADGSQQLIGLTVAGGKSTVSTTSLNQFCIRSISVQVVSVPPERSSTMYDFAARSVTL